MSMEFNKELDQLMKATKHAINVASESPRFDLHIDKLLIDFGNSYRKLIEKYSMQDVAINLVVYD